MRLATLGTYWGNRLAVLIDDSLVDLSAAHAAYIEPGDLISTGSPSGVGKIKPGDLIEGEVEGIGAIRNRVIAEEPSED